MRRPYREEVEELTATYEAVSTLHDVGALARALLLDRPMVFLGSGGTRAVAELAADLHREASGQAAVAMTPLDYACGPVILRAGICLFSARGRHPDAALAIQAGLKRASCPVVLVTCREAGDLPSDVAAAGVTVHTVPSPADGFLATNSILAMATTVCRAYGFRLPPRLPHLALGSLPAPRQRCILLFGPGFNAVARDLEARLAETGVRDVQTVDYRNLAHGRHVGLHRNLLTTTLIATVAPTFSQLAERTLAVLPSETDVIRLETELAWPASVLDLLVASMQLAGVAASSVGADPGRPRVPKFGRDLYHLRYSRTLDIRTPDPIDRKLGAAGLGRNRRYVFAQAQRTWIDAMTSIAFKGLVLDYDGTCCTTEGRFSPPPQYVREEVLRLLDAGIHLGIATGRGKSVLADTRGWVPEPFWARLHVGLYNGSVPLTLADDLTFPGPGALAEAALRVEEALSRVEGLIAERRPTQVTVTAPGLLGAQLLSIIQALLAQPPVLPVKALASAHSVDLVPSGASKADVLFRISRAAKGQVLAVGDQGNVGGNDFELLAAAPTTLSVDQCSGDPTRCWNLDNEGLVGPPLLERYLRALRRNRGAFGFHWKSP